jgi:hypothetical protein
MGNDPRTYQERKDYLREYQRKYYHRNKKHRQRCLDRNKTFMFREYQKRWVQENRDKIKKIDEKYRKSEKRKIYLKGFRNTAKFKVYQREWSLKNPEKVKERYSRYSSSLKGKNNQIIKTQNRRFKFKKIAGKLFDRPPKDLRSFVDKRDGICVYCKIYFDCSKQKGKNYPTYDHLNAFLPHSKINTVRCCNSCNGSKRDRDVLEWLSFKGFKPSRKILTLLSSQSVG